MSSKRSDSGFASELLSLPPLATAAPLAAAPVSARPPPQQPSAEDFEGTETVVLATGSGSGAVAAGVPRLDDLRRLSRQIHQSERWERNGR